MKRKKKFLEIALIVSLLILITTSFNANAEESNEEINIICANSVLADFTLNIAPQDITTVEYILPAGICPAQFEQRPSDINKTRNADIIISFGNLHMESWLEKLLSKTDNEYSRINCSQLGEWNVPTNAIKYVQKISDELIKILPEYNATIKENSENYITTITTTAEELKQKIENEGIKNRTVVCVEWYKDLLDYFGLNVSYYYGSPEGLSLKDEMDVINAVSEEEVSAVIDNLQSGTEFGARVASETGKTHVILSNFPYAVPGTDTYIKTMKYNVNQTIEGIQTYDYKKGEIQELESKIDGLNLQRNASLGIAGILALLSIVLFVMFKRK